MRHAGASRGGGRPQDNQWRQSCNVILKNLHGMQSHTITLVYVSTVIALVEKIRDSGNDRRKARGAV